MATYVNEPNIKLEDNEKVITYLTQDEDLSIIANSFGYEKASTFSEYIVSTRKQILRSPETVDEINKLYEYTNKSIRLMARWYNKNVNRTRSTINKVVMEAYNVRYMYEEQDLSFSEIADKLPPYIDKTNVLGYVRRNKIHHSNKTGRIGERRRKAYTPEYFKKRDQKRHKTNMERYGVLETTQLSQVKEAREKALLSSDKKNNSHNLSSEDRLTKEIARAIFEYIKNVSSSDRAIRGFLEFYKITSSMTRTDMEYRVRHTNEKLYGHKWGEVLDSRYTSTFVLTKAKYLNRTNHINFNSAQEAYATLVTEQYLKEDLGNNTKYTLTEIANYLGLNYSLIVKHAPYLDSIGILKRIVTVSEVEKDVEDFIKSLGIKYEFSNRKALGNSQEIDIYLPDSKIGIEFNGYYWHSSDFKGQDYHANKTALARKAGISLYHIWEYDWMEPNKREIIKSQIKYKLGLISNRHYARKLELVNVSMKEALDFFNENHIQGANSIGNISYGLVDPNTGILLSVMNFGKRLKTSYEWELIRFASKINTVVVGGASKLFKHFIDRNHPDNVQSFANNDFAYSYLSGKSVYQQLGFEYIHTARPSYAWVKPNKKDEPTFTTILSRYKVQPKKLVSFTNGETKEPFREASRDFRLLDSNETEEHYMKRNGWYKIWNAGRDLYVYQAE